MVSDNNPSARNYKWLDIECCPGCGCAVRAGELACTKCGFAFSYSKTGKTRQVEELQPLTYPGCNLSNQPLLDKAIMFEIDGLTLPLPPVQQLTVGRSGEGSAADIDL